MSEETNGPRTEVTYIVQYRRPGDEKWLTWPSTGTASGARATYQTLIGKPRYLGTQFRLVERTSVVTDRVLEGPGNVSRG